MGEALVEDASRRLGEVQGEESDCGPLGGIRTNQNSGRVGLVKDTRIMLGV